MLPMALLLAACSGGSSRDEEDQEEPEEVAAPPPSTEGNGEGPTADGLDEAYDLHDIIRALDRVVDRADAHILRAGLDADMASSSPPLDVLEARLQSMRIRLAEIRAMHGEASR